MHYTGFALLLALLLANTALGVELTNNNFQISRSVLSDSLTQQTIRQTFQDNAGLLWVVTQASLHRYDGYRLSTHRTAESASGTSGHSNVQQILQDRFGTIWIATNGEGLQYYDAENSHFTRLAAGSDGSTPLSANISSLYADSSGFLWIGYFEGYVSLFNPSDRSFRHATAINDTAAVNGAITGFAQHNSEVVWIGTSKAGLLKLNRYHGRLKRFLHHSGKQRAPGDTRDSSDKDTLPSSNIQAMAFDDEGTLWIGTFTNGIVLLDPESERAQTLVHDQGKPWSISDNTINTIYQDNANRIWIGTDFGLNLHLGAGRFARFNSTNSNLVEDVVRTIGQDAQENFWIGTFFGLYTGYQSMFDTFDTKRGLPGELITTFAEADDGKLWIGSYEGLFYFDEVTGNFGTVEEKFPLYRLKDRRVMSIESTGNALWIGTRSAGVDWLDLESGQHRSYGTHAATEATLSNNAITDILADSADNIWIATYGGGLNFLDAATGKSTAFQRSADSEQSISSDYVFAAYETAGGDIYAATSAGLNWYNKATQQVQRLPVAASQAGVSSGPSILAVHEDSLGNVWLGLDYDGLAMWSAKDIKLNNFISRKPRDKPNLKNLSVVSITEDHNGMLWFATASGLVKLNPPEHTTTYFSISDGLQDNDFLVGSSYKDKKGRLYFGGSRGYNRFHPDDIVDAKTPPTLTLTGIKIVGKAVATDVAYQPPAALQLSHEDYFVDFEFSVLDFTEPAKNQYKYKLENFDNQWIDIGTRHNAFFTNLPPGEYTLRVQGANSNHVWSDAAISLPLKVLPPPWFSWWAFAIYIAAFTGALLFLKKYYDTHVLKERADQLAATLHATAERAMDDLQDQLHIEQSLVQNIHDHFQDTFRIVSDLLARQALEIQDDAVVELFAENQLRFECLQHMESNLFYIADRLQVNFHGFVESLLAARFASENITDLDIVVINNCSEAALPVEIAIPGALIVNELVNNAIKHAFDSTPGMHYLKIGCNENEQLSGWTLEVSDSGCGLPLGIDPGNPATLGMEIVQHFCGRLNASLSVTRERGTHYTIAIPKPAVSA